MKDISVVLSQEVTEAKIILLGDTHVGSPQFNETKLLEIIEYIKNNDDVYTILMGDLIDNALKTTKANPYKAIMSPQASLKHIIKILTPIKDKILLITPGNHEEKTEIEVDVDITWFIARELGLEDRYSEFSFILYISMGKNRNRKGTYHTFSIYGTHGSSSGTTYASALNKVISLADTVVNADVYVMNHVHKPIVTYTKRYVVDLRTKKHYSQEPLFVTGNAFLDFKGSYGERKMYRPTSQRIPMIVLRTSSITKSVDLEFKSLVI